MFPFRDEEAKTEIRKWMGEHNGISILKTDWCWNDSDRWHSMYDTYLLKITNPRTEMLFLLAFPQAKDITELNCNESDNDWRRIDKAL